MYAIVFFFFFVSCHVKWIFKVLVGTFVCLNIGLFSVVLWGLLFWKSVGVTLDPPDPIRPRWSSAASMPTVSVKRDLLFEALGQTFSTCLTLIMCIKWAHSSVCCCKQGKCAQCVFERAWFCLHMWKSVRNILIKQFIFYKSFILLSHLIITEQIYIEIQNEFKLHAIASDSNTLRF